MDRWFDDGRGCEVSIAEHKGAINLLASPGQLITATYSKLLVQHAPGGDGIQRIELQFDLDLANLRKLVRLGGIVPFDENFLAPYASGVFFHVDFLARDRLLRFVKSHWREGVDLEHALIRRDDNEFAAAFDLSNYLFENLGELTKAQTSSEPAL